MSAGSSNAFAGPRDKRSASELSVDDQSHRLLEFAQ